MEGGCIQSGLVAVQALHCLVLGAQQCKPSTRTSRFLTCPLHGCHGTIWLDVEIYERLSHLLFQRQYAVSAMNWWHVLYFGNSSSNKASLDLILLLCLRSAKWYDLFSRRLCILILIFIPCLFCQRINGDSIQLVGLYDVQFLQEGGRIGRRNCADSPAGTGLVGPSVKRELKPRRSTPTG